MSSEPTADELATLIASVKPWDNRGTYTDANWRHTIDVARSLQHRTRSENHEAFRRFSTTNTQHFRDGYEEDSKPYILLRIMFEVPTNASPFEEVSFKAWHGFTMNTNVDGTKNLCWPLAWKNERPYFISCWLGSEGGSYHPEEEFDYMASKFKYRNLNIFDLK